MYCIQIIQEKFFSLHEIEKSIEEGKKAIKIKYLSKVIEDSILFLKEDWPENSSIKNELENIDRQFKLSIKGKDNDYYIGRWQEISIRLEELVIVKKYLLTLQKYLLVLDKFIISLKEYNKLENSSNYSFLAMLFQPEDHLISIQLNKKEQKENKEKVNNSSNTLQNNHTNSTKMKSSQKQKSYKENKKTTKNKLFNTLQEKKSMSEFYFHHLQRVIKIMKALMEGRSGIKDNLITRIKQRIFNFSKKEYNTGNYTETYLILFEVLNHLKKI